MKTISKVLTILSAAILFVPSLTAQTAHPEKYQLNNGIGYNKYLVSTTPDADGDYMLRLETFSTGEVKEQTVPVDFVLVLDGSGSMMYDSPVPGIPQDGRPAVIEGDDARFGMRDSGDYDGLRYYAYNGIYRHATWDSSKKQWSEGQGGYNFPQPFSNSSLASRYYYSKADKTYYRILRGTAKDNTGSTYYYLYFNRTKSGANGRIWYVYSDDNGNMATKQSTNGKEPYEDVPYFKKITSASQIIVAPRIGDNINYDDINNANSWAHHFFRPKQRREALIEGLDQFIEQIAQENANDSKWAANVTRHQVAMVSFTGRYNNTANKDDITPSSNATAGSTYDDSVILSSPENKSRVLRGFSAISASNKSAYKNIARNSIRFSGGAGTHPNQGLRLARLLLEAEQVKANMAPLNNLGGVNRNKVVIFFTDGTPQAINTNDIHPVAGLSGVSGMLYATFLEGQAIKAERTSPSGSQINAKMFCVDYSHSDEAQVFLKYLSSNYPDGNYTQTTGAADPDMYTGTLISPPSSRIYYQDATQMDISSAFKFIADSSIGDKISSNMAVVDKVTDSFFIPASVTSKIKFYTAQCIGQKTIDGETYLAFAQDVAVPDRTALGTLWVKEGDSDDGGWVKKTGLDIDNNISFSVSADQKSLTITGFDYSMLWCGLDPVHTDNTRQTPITKNASFALDGYRGFKFIVEFPIKLTDDAIGGPYVPTNDETVSGVYNTDDDGHPVGGPVINYPVPSISIPVSLVIQKTGLKVGESASFTVQRKLASASADAYVDYISFVLTGDDSATPEVSLLNMDPAYHYRIKETGWSWAYSNGSMTAFPSTEDPELKNNPVVFDNTPKETDVKHAEAKATNVMGSDCTQH